MSFTTKYFKRERVIQRLSLLISTYEALTPDKSPHDFQYKFYAHACSQHIQFHTELFLPFQPFFPPVDAHQKFQSHCQHPHLSCLSNLPGLKSAASKTSGLFVAAITMTGDLSASKPSISERSWFSVCSLSSLPPIGPEFLLLPIASISSIKTIAGASFLAFSKGIFLQLIMPDNSSSHIGAYVPFRRFLKRGSEEGGHVKKKICMIDAKGLGCTLGVDKLKALKCQSCPKIRRVPFPDGKF